MALNVMGICMHVRTAMMGAMSAAVLFAGGGAAAQSGDRCARAESGSHLPAPGSRVSKGEFDGATFSVVAENDLFGGTDRNYTNGVQFSIVSSARCELWGTRFLSRHFLPGRFRPEDRTWRAGFTLGQAMFTPADISLTDPDPADRPYAGWLYTSFTLISETERSGYISGLDTAKLDLGWVGDGAQGEWVQRNFHHLIQAREPRGWGHQIKDEPGLNLTLESTRRRRFLDTRWLEADADLRGGVALGNVATYATVGAMARIGSNLGRDYGPPRIRPSLGGASFFTPDGAFGWYLFAGVEGRAVARDIFLDGNSFRDSRSVEKEPFVVDAQAGVALRLGRARVTFTYVHRTESFEGQNGPDKFGAVTLSVRR